MGCLFLVWVAVIFDLVEKLRDLALAGDTEAWLMIEKYERWQRQIEEGNLDAVKQSLDFERTLVDVSQAKFGFFEPQQLLELRMFKRVIINAILKLFRCSIVISIAPSEQA